MNRIKSYTKHIFKQDVIRVPMATSASSSATETEEDGDFLVTKLLLRDTVRPADTGGGGGREEQPLDLSPDKSHRNLHELSL